VIESETVLTSMTRIVHGIDWLLRQFARPEYEDLPAIVNMSLGFAPSAPGHVNPWMYERQVRAIRMLTQALVNANVLPVVAVGNRGEGTYGLPAGFDHVIAVGAVDTELRVAEFSGSGKNPGERNGKPDLVGYGVDVYSSLERDYDGRSIYTRLDGTSMAAPYVSGIGALMRCEDRFATVDEIREKLRADARSISGQKASRVGAGLARYVA
jgi:subtilisin family serine protease